MTRPRSLACRLLSALLLALLGLLAVPGAALAATTPADVSASLRRDPVFVEDDAEARGQVDADRVRQAIRDSGRQIYVAVLPSRAATASGGPDALTSRIGAGLGSGAVLFTVAGSTLAGGAGPQAGLQPGEAASIASSSAGGDLTSSLVTAVQRAGRSAGDGGGTSGGTSGGGTSSSGGGSGLGVLGVLVLLFGGGGALLYARSRRRRGREQEGSRADVESLYNRLGADVANLDPGDDAVARQALADASERYTATGALLDKADTPGEFEAARRTVVEGLTAARLVRTRRGLDPGPEVPPPPGSGGPQLRGDERVRVGDQEYDGSPSYAPGRQHYWGGGYVGGQMVPGGWYGVPFWETVALGTVLSGGLGGFGGGYGGGYGGYGYGGGGFERGYEEGVEDARDARGDSGGGWGGGWGGGGGGDWGGGGGGDWGGGGGGGDWGGGGGGDSGGGW